MASVQKTANGYRAQIYVRGVRESGTFKTKRDAEAWAARRQSELLESADKPASGRRTLRDALTRYRDEIVPTKRGRRWEHVRIEAFLNPITHPFLPRDVVLSKLGPESFAAWRDWRMTRVQAGTVIRELSLMSSVLTAARREWRWMEDNPLSDLRRPREPDHREVLISPSQVRAMLRALGWTPAGKVRQVRQAVACCFLFALRTGMRAGEVSGLTWKRVHRYHCATPHKTGRTAESLRDVPLSRQARRVIAQMEGWDETLVFGVGRGTLDALFRKYRQRAGLDGFTFHDSRHTAATMLSRKLDVLTLCKMFGWKNTSQALVYFNPKASDIAKRLR